MNSYPKAIRKFLSNLDKHINDISDDQSLLEAGVVDSLKMVELLSFIEEQYGIVIDDDELIPENFETIAAIADFLEQKSK